MKPFFFKNFIVSSATMKKLYCFDFDGTLTKRDTLFAFLKFYDCRRFFISYLKHLPLFIMSKLKIANTERVKKSFISSVLKGESQEKIQQKAQQFFNENYPKIIRENTLEFIQNIDRENTESYIVTASLDIWVQPFAAHLGMHLIATEARFEGGVYSGNFKTKNCTGEEKVKRIKKAIENKKFDKIIAFGDSEGDREMLEWADESYYQFFH